MTGILCEEVRGFEFQIYVRWKVEVKVLIVLFDSVIPSYYSTQMKKQSAESKQEPRINAKTAPNRAITREYVDNMRGEFRCKGLMKDLKVEKKREREL